MRRTGPVMRAAAVAAVAVSSLLSASLLGLLRTVSAHLGECAISTDKAFDYQVSVTTEFTLYWAVDRVSDDITIQAVYEGDAWISVGFSESGGMLGSDAVIGLPDEETAAEYYLAAYDISGVTEAPLQEISGAAVTQADSTTTLVFTRPLSPSDPFKNTLLLEEGVEATLIWAFGADNTLAWHRNRGDITVGDLFCSVSAGDDDADNAVVSDGSCASSDPDYDFEVSPSQILALLWRVVDDGKSVSVKAIYEGEGWLGVGFSEDGAMAGSDAVIGLPASLTALEYDMDDYSTPVVALEQEITNATITQDGGVTTLTFVRPLEPAGDGKQVLYATGELIWLFAWGGSNEFVEHVAEGAIVLRLDSCSIRAAGEGAGEGGTKSKYAHAWLMVIGWSICFPFGVIFARFSQSFAKLGFPAHRALQSSGALFGLAGFVVAIVFTENTGSEHFEKTHGVLGLGMTALVLLQVIYAVFRPHPPPSAPPMAQLPADQVPAAASGVRRAWSVSHRTVGYVLLILTVFQCLGGIELLHVKEIWRTLYVALAALLVLIFVLLQLAACCSKSKAVSAGEVAHLLVNATTGTT